LARFSLEEAGPGRPLRWATDFEAVFTFCLSLCVMLPPCWNAALAPTFRIVRGGASRRRCPAFRGFIRALARGRSDAKGPEYTADVQRFFELTRATSSSRPPDLSLRPGFCLRGPHRRRDTLHRATGRRDGRYPDRVIYIGVGPLSQSRPNCSAACLAAWRELSSISSITCSVGRGRSRSSPSSGALRCTFQAF
jgi:hypothetical protein